MRHVKLLLIAIIFLFLSQASFAQSCNCDVAFKWATKAFEENDAGFQYIIDQKGREAYNAHNTTYQKKVNKITNPDSCVKAMRQWAKFFRVGHFGFIVNPPASEKAAKSQNIAVSVKKTGGNNRDNKAPYARLYDSGTVYLRVPTFDSRYKKVIDSVISANTDLIKSNKNLIIDITDNGGGDDRSFSEIIPFLYTNPIRNVSVARLSTPHNNKFWEDLQQNSLSSSDKTYYADVVSKLNANIGKFVMLNDSVYTTRYSTVYQFPQNVAILINGNNGSTAEQFLLAARQSKKVKLFGTTTMGELDISNMYSINSPDGRYTLWYCMSKSLRIPENTIDNKGISPDYYLDKSIPKSGWLTYVAEVLHQW
ncbi:MAG: S41 family peptidase [Bacteroidota bacterium]